MTQQMPDPYFTIPAVPMDCLRIVGGFLTAPSLPSLLPSRWVSHPLHPAGDRLVSPSPALFPFFLCMHWCFVSIPFAGDDS